MPMTDWNELLLDQLTWHWEQQLRPRLEGLTDDEYLWEPVAGCWSLRPEGEGVAEIAAGGGRLKADFQLPQPEPAPVTTIAWRIAHLLIGVFGNRNAAQFGGEPVDYFTYDYPETAADALTRLDAGYSTWRDGVRSLGADGLQRASGASEHDWSEEPVSRLILHIHREVIHHGAEICLLRDLYTHRPLASAG
jgi:DinB superfamily